MNGTPSTALPLRGDWLFPTEIRFGAGRVSELRALCDRFGMKRPLIVTDRGLAATPLAERVLAAADGPGIAPRFFTGLQENPTGGNIAEGVAAFRAWNADGVVALGGGSGLDGGKTIALMAGAGGSLWRFAWPDHAAAQSERAGVPIIAIPTTAGTGAEVEPSAIITDERGPTKRAVLHPAMLPKAVIADPELTVTLPRGLTAATGMDALSHNLEALCVPSFHPMADAIAASGIAMIGRWLPVALAEPQNLTARGYMMAAAIMGATAFGKGLGAMHALSHAIGALKGCHHGLTNAVLMPFVLAYNRPAIEPAMMSLAEILRLEGEAFPAVHRWILDLRRRIGIPETVAGLGLAPSEFDRVARLAAADICADMNPVPVDAASLKSILEAAA
ncbi:alcohol dehydrogenase [Hypericibacter adhaerens]|jgi:alcohol dehydrogenase class IV|uniref:Alcohol dehydrogenase n=1 Tax=Hypericibacter adhaerens TaxID=2602016 RepID=A0A5J6MT05_9PROT|nr:iron-containing alcohol dehydrogenase [Hypericibacter adhaerens]QEX20391.1 alcohol dehydrogenase [Hypericibacter adhaerens]